MRCARRHRHGIRTSVRACACACCGHAADRNVSFGIRFPCSRSDTPPNQHTSNIGRRRPEMRPFRHLTNSSHLDNDNNDDTDDQTTPNQARPEMRFEFRIRQLCNLGLASRLDTHTHTHTLSDDAITTAVRFARRQFSVMDITGGGCSVGGLGGGAA